ncbi:MAG: hypothetical protein LC790_08165 [Actinobacteria bacterium]|nr:hypothetical protein [Actinomycetota bacterium]
MALRAILAELGLQTKDAKTRIVHMREGGETLDFLGFEHRWVRGNTTASRHLRFLVRRPTRKNMQRARDRMRELTLRKRLLLSVDEVVADLNRYLRGFGGYFRYGNSGPDFGRLDAYAIERLALFVAKRHKRQRRYGYWRISQSPDRLGLIRLTGTIVAPRPNRASTRSAWTGTPNAGRRRTSVSRVRENRLHGSMRRREETMPVARARAARPRRLPPTLPDGACMTGERLDPVSIC